MSATRIASAQTAVTPPRSEITAYPGFRDVCTGFVIQPANLTGGASDGSKFAGLAGHCAAAPPIVFSVTQENPHNNHVGAKNFSPGVTVYMSDLNRQADIGRWVNFQLSLGTSPTLSLGLDTEDYHQTNVTGWPLQYGHLFAAFNDLSAQTGLGQATYVEFDIRIRQSDVAQDTSNPYNGLRVMLGALLHWEEPAPRTNGSHYLEIDLLKSPGYSESYGDKLELGCNDQTYDRCFYDPNGKYAEGRFVNFRERPWDSSGRENTGHWIHTKIPITAIAHTLGWASPPRSWQAARLDGIYIGIESEGSARTLVDIRNYHVYVEK